MTSDLRYQHLFFDLDHTLWDFEANSFITLGRIHQNHGLSDKTGNSFEIFHHKYTVHNHYYWNQYTLGLISQEDLRWTRMHRTLDEFGVNDQDLAKQLSREYLELLPESTLLFPYATELLTYLKRRGYQLHILSNGFEEVQHKKLICAGIHSFFDQIITSERSRCVKPDKEIFDFALLHSGADRETSIMIGDNPEVDLQGAINAEMDSIYVDHQSQPSKVPSTFTVRHLKEIELVL